MLEPYSFARSVVFSIFFAGIEYRYINRREAEWTMRVDGFYEKAAFWLISPYQAYLLLPLFIVVAFATPAGAWAANTFLIALLEDVLYFVWRRRRVSKGEWTTRPFGSFTLGGYEVPVWWPLCAVLTAGLYLAPF